MEMSNDTVSEEEAPKPRAKGEVNYGPGMEGQDCLGCEHFKEPDRCHKVRGEISPTGLCDLWENPSSVDGLEFGDSESIEKLLFGSVEDME